MCVIILVPEGLEIPKETIELAIERNPHGWGMSTRKRGAFEVHKGFTVDEAWRKWKRMGTGAERIFHARVATHGEITIENLHPFDASYYGPNKEFAPRLLYHNGVINGIPILDKKLSDSHHLAKALQPYPGGKDVADELQRIALREASRLVLSTLENTWFMGNGWITREGVRYSNGSCLGAKETGRRVYAGGLLDDKVESDKHFPGAVWDNQKKMYVGNPNYQPPALYGPNDTEVGGGDDWGFYYRGPRVRRGVAHDDFSVSPLVEQTSKKGLPYRWCDKNGQWWEVVRGDGTEHKSGARVTVDGPHEDTVFYGMTNSQGIGQVYSWGPSTEDTLRVVGRYHIDKLTPYIIEQQHLNSRKELWEKMNAEGEQEESAVPEKVRLHNITQNEWELVEAASVMKEFEDKDTDYIVTHIRKNKGSLFPLPAIVDVVEPEAVVRN